MKILILLLPLWVFAEGKLAVEDLDGKSIESAIQADASGLSMEQIQKLQEDLEIVKAKQKENQEYLDKLMNEDQ